MPLDALDPRSTAVLVIDMQNGFAHPEGAIGASGVDLGDVGDVIAKTRRLVEVASAAGLPVLWTLQQHLVGDATRDKKRFQSHTAKRVRVPGEEGTWDAQLVDELAPLATNPVHVIQKHRFGCFYDTRLGTLLRARGVDSLIVMGATANACVETTLREAYMRDLDVVAVTDCIVTVRQDWYETAKEVWSQFLCELATAAEVEAWLTQSGVSATAQTPPVAAGS
jgi:ureidoacrylate peracid hydrolase